MLKRALPFLLLFGAIVAMQLLVAKPQAPGTQAAGTVAPPPPSVGLTAQDVNLPPVEKALRIFRALDAMDPKVIPTQLDAYKKQISDSAAYNTEHPTDFFSKLLHRGGPDADKLLQLGYAQERIADPKTGTYADALAMYHQAARRPYASVAQLRIAQIEELLLKQNPAGTPMAEDARKQIIGALEPLTNLPAQDRTLLRQPPVGSAPLQEWQVVPARETAARWLDVYYRTDWRYPIFSTLVRITGAHKPFSYVFAIFLIAVLAKLVTTPFTASQFRSMRKMSAVQPELKKLQEKYKGNKEALAKAQMDLFKQHGVNPASSCLPMILQLVILWQVYYAIRHFMWGFWGVPFLYLHNLALPDTLGAGGFPGPLLLLYAVSMYFSTKLTSMPAATPEQQQQQRMMSTLMPVMLLFVLRGLPAAFILYWLLQNIFMTGHQWLIMRPHREEMAAKAAAAPAGPATDKSGPKAKPEALAPPPPAAIERISQGSRNASKKKGKRRG